MDALEAALELKNTDSLVAALSLTTPEAVTAASPHRMIVLCIIQQLAVDFSERSPPEVCVCLTSVHHHDEHLHYYHHVHHRHHHAGICLLGSGDAIGLVEEPHDAADAVESSSQRRRRECRCQ